MGWQKNNNFDLIRLLAATQVVVIHAIEHFRIEVGPGLPQEMWNLAMAFPGVPIFFTISGFLIFWSFERNPNLQNYFLNRSLRIFPGLWVCFLCTVLLLWYFGVLNISNVFTPQVAAWFATQLSFMQFYTPEILRGFGVGTPNGSLWTIPIEIQFYCAVPILFYLIGKTHTLWGKNCALLGLFLLSFAANVVVQQFNSHEMPHKLMSVCLLPYLFYFLLGSIIYKNYHRLKPWIERRFFIWLAIYIGYYLLFSRYLGWYGTSYWPNTVGLGGTALLSFATISLAFTAPNLSRSLLFGYDLSYGIYIYHMLVINTLVQLGHHTNLLLIPICLLATCFLALGSWVLVEKPALGLKRSPMHANS